MIMLVVIAEEKSGQASQGAILIIMTTHCPPKFDTNLLFHLEQRKRSRQKAKKLTLAGSGEGGRERGVDKKVGRGR